MYRNKIIVFEGIEGSGKTSHLNFVSNYLKRKKIPHLKLREPGGTRNSAIINQTLIKILIFCYIYLQEVKILNT